MKCVGCYCLICMPCVFLIPFGLVTLFEPNSWAPVISETQVNSSNYAFSVVRYIVKDHTYSCRMYQHPKLSHICYSAVKRTRCDVSCFTSFSMSLGCLISGILYLMLIILIGFLLYRNKPSLSVVPSNTDASNNNVPNCDIPLSTIEVNTSFTHEDAIQIAVNGNGIKSDNHTVVVINPH